MGLFGNLFRRRKRVNNPDGSRSVTVHDKHGRLRKTKHKGPSGTYKQRFDRSGNMYKAKQKGRGIKRMKQRFMNLFKDGGAVGPNGVL